MADLQPCGTRELFAELCELLVITGDIFIRCL